MTEATVAPPRFGRSSILSVVENGVPLTTIHGYDDSGATPFGLRIAFQVQRAIKPMADTATIRIWNLSETNRSMFAQRTLAFVRSGPLRYVRLEAGYAGDGHTGVIFNGAIVQAVNMRQGPDWLTEIELSAIFGQALLNNFSKSWGGAAGTPVKTILGEIFETAGFGQTRYTPTADDALIGNKEVSYAVVGSAYRSARQLLSAHGLTFNVDVDGVTIYKQGHPRGDDFIPIDEQTGLLGTPKVTALGTNFRTLLDPRIRPGQLVRIDSPTLRSSLANDPNLGRDYTVWEVKVTGDTHSDDWFCDVIAYYHPPLEQVATPIPGPTLAG